MILTYFENEKASPLVEEFYELLCGKECIPFKTPILPLGQTNITYVFSKGQKALINAKEIPLFGLMVSGQFYKSYQLISNQEGSSFGMSLHPTALHKILNTDISKLENKHVPLSKINKECFAKLNPIFSTYTNPKKAIKDINLFLRETPLTINQNTILIDKAITLIRAKEGLLSIDDILKEVNLSQKTLETQFKKIVGITPGKYIRLFRFLKLMKKYENQEIDLQDLIYMYNYYDTSHFNKDFKLFMNDTPTSYFSKEYPFLKKILKK